MRHNQVKPLPPILLTKEDTAIWCRVYLRHGRRPEFGVVPAVLADRRDAELMLRAQEVAQFGPAAIELYGIACRGRNSPPYWIEDTADGEGIWQR
jgi:hypothetical protein